jgi:nucleoside-diphosphate-sugar epimerase
LCIENRQTVNEDFNLSTAESTSVLELAQMIWKKINGGKPFRYVSDAPFKYDVQKRVPDVSKARQMIGFEALTPLKEALDEIIPWIKQQITIGGI